MSMRKVIALSGLLAVAMASSVHAESGDKAVNACVKTFVENYLPKDRVVRVRKEQPFGGGILSAYPRSASTITVALTARGARSGVQLAQARCVASPRGDVIVIDNPPVESYTANADYVAVVAR